ncbi:MAG: hypothetical protein J6X93_03900 [Bacilli bacterium]|nr:hypothetical protein [Bacilli bacterium]
MAIKKKIYFIIFPIIVVSILFVIFELWLYIRDEKRYRTEDKIEKIFEKYENNENIADITSASVEYREYEKSIFAINKIYDNNQIILTSNEVFYLYERGLSNVKITFYSMNMLDNVVNQLYTTESIKKNPKYMTFDNCFYILYSTKDESNIIDVYDVIEKRYYNYSKGENVNLEDIRYEEQKKKYNIDVKITDDRKSFEIKDLLTDEVTIINNDYFENSQYREDMSKVEYKPCKIYISYGHILLIYRLGLNNIFTSDIVYEYDLENNSIQFVYFNKSVFSDERYEYISNRN